MNNTSAANVSQTNDQSSSKDATSKTEGIVSFSALILTSVLTVAGNTLTIVLFAMKRNIRKKHFFLAVNLASADLLLGAVSLPIYSCYVGFNFGLWTLTERFSTLTWLHILFQTVDTFFSQASLISAAFISCERFHAIYRPFKHKTLSTRTYCNVIFVLWLLALLISALLIGSNLLLSYKYTGMIWGPYIFLLIFIICGCYIGIWRKFKGGIASASHQQNGDLQNKRLTKTLLFVSGFTLLAWLPLVITNFLIILGFLPIDWKFYPMVNLFNYSNSLVNPFVYALRVAEFRRALTSCRLGRAPALNTALPNIRNERNGTSV